LARYPDLASVLQCPRCARGRLALHRAGWICDGCSAGFPSIGDIPWLFPEPQAMLAEWRGRLAFLLAELAREAATLRDEAARAVPASLTARRLQTLAAANDDHGRRLKALLSPLGAGDSAISYETHLALRTRLPMDQGLTNYYVNVHRDWAWGDAENTASLSAVRTAAGGEHAWGRTLVLGAGAGRLAYDVHTHCGPELTVAVDYNPLLLFAMRQIVEGGVVELYEFPIAPRSLADHALLRALQAPAPARAGFSIVAADALHAPFAESAFQTILTPWLIDVVDEELARFAARVNRWLAPGGAWINHGSLSFAQGERSQRLSLEEALECVAGAGFSLAHRHEADMPYMRSPASRHGRIESTLSWRAVKMRDAPPPPEHARLPEWLLRPDVPVPLSQDFQVQALSTRIHAFLMSLIDGKRSVRDMARMLVDQRLMEAREAEGAVRGFLARMHADARMRAGY
jgi:hypothetical protein